MTQNRPTAAELVDAVKTFLNQDVKPVLEDHTAFNMMVALKSLDIVQRELERGPEFAEAERARLVEILGRDGTLDALNQELTDRLRAGTLTLNDPTVKTHLIETTKAKVQIDQPKYSGLKQALESGGGE
ncbi:MAG: hypothetical protein HQ511_11035 [Rhodospirillales bacterium]|nr:hypothetical protein [Rhodospirillales bacterium]